MDNYEFYYRQQIEKITRLGLGFGIYKTTGEVDFCSLITCTDCKFFGGCNIKKINWADEEYQELPVDWSKVPIDTKVLASNDGKHWFNQYFAGVDDKGKPLIWGGGVTSWSAYSKDNYTAPNYIKLAEDKE